MHKRIILLLAITIVLSLSVINIRYQTRLRFAQLQGLQLERDALDVEWGKLLLEQATWSEHRRVEEVARAQLDMVTPQSQQVIMPTGAIIP